MRWQERLDGTSSKERSHIRQAKTLVESCRAASDYSAIASDPLTKYYVIDCCYNGIERAIPRGISPDMEGKCIRAGDHGAALLMEKYAVELRYIIPRQPAPPESRHKDDSRFAHITSDQLFYYSDKPTIGSFVNPCDELYRATYRVAQARKQYDHTHCMSEKAATQMQSDLRIIKRCLKQLSDGLNTLEATRRISKPPSPTHGVRDLDGPQRLSEQVDIAPADEQRLQDAETLLIAQCRTVIDAMNKLQHHAEKTRVRTDTPG